MHTSRVVVCLLIGCSFLLACATPAPPQEPATPPRFAKSAAAMPAPGASAGHELRVEGGPVQQVGADDQGLVVAGADGSHSRRLEAGVNRSGFELAVAARGLRAEGDGLHWDWLAALSHDAEAGLSVLSIHDGDGGLLHEEVLRESCESLGWSALEAPELLVECDGHVWRYQEGPAEEAILSGAAFARSGGAFGPLSFGDSPARVQAALQLQGATCATSSCSLFAIQLEGRDFKLAAQYRSQQLERVTLFGPRRTRGQWWTKVRGDWSALAERFGGAAAADEVAFPPVRALAAKPLSEGWSFAETHRPQQNDKQLVIGVYRNESEQGDGFGAIAILAPPTTDGGAAPAAAAD